LWRQILADVLGVELAMVNTTEGAAYGAAILAGVGVGNGRM
jgi:xylulokinase